MNDAQEKLDQAEEWLKTSDVFSVRFQAAFDHVCHVYNHAADDNMKAQARRIIESWRGKDWLN